MGIDASIISGLRPVQIQQPQDPLDRANKELTYKSLMAQGQVQQQGMEDDAAQRQALINSGGDNARYRALLMGSGQHKAVQALDKATFDQRAKEAEIKAHEAAAGKSTTEDALKKLEHGAALLDGVNDQASYDRARRVGKITGTFPPEALSQFPEQYDPQFIASMKQAGVTRAQQLTEQGQAATRAQTATRDTAADTRARTAQAETARHNAATEGDPTTVESTAQAIAKGQLAPLNGFALSKPMGQQIMSRVAAIHQEAGTTFDPTQFGTRQKAEKDFATGKQGNSVRSFNVGLSHLDTLDQLADAMKNGNTQLINKVANSYATQSGNPAPVNFEAAKKIVGDEIVKAIVGAGGGVSDREEASKTLAAANSPAQLKGVIQTYKELMRGQLGGLRDQYKASTGKDDFDMRYLSPAARIAAHPSAKPGTAKAPAGMSDDELRKALGI